MQMKQVGIQGGMERYRPMEALKKDETESVTPRDAFVRGEEVIEQPSRFKEMSAGGTKKSWGTVKSIAMHTTAGITATIGGIVGFAIGAAYDATVIGPLIGAGVYADDHYNTSYLDGLVKQVLSPVTLAIKGAKHGYDASIRAWDS